MSHRRKMFVALLGLAELAFLMMATQRPLVNRHSERVALSLFLDSPTDANRARWSAEHRSSGRAVWILNLVGCALAAANGYAIVRIMSQRRGSGETERRDA
jgi:hypothetical protein